MEGDSRIPVGKFTTCWCWGQISPPLPLQATKLNILKAPAIGAHGTPGSQRVLCPSEKKPPTHIPKFRVPAMETPGTYTLTLDPASFSSRSSPPCSHPLPPSPLQPGPRVRRTGGGVRTCPRRPRPDNARETERAPGRSHPAPATLTLSLVSR